MRLNALIETSSQLIATYSCSEDAADAVVDLVGTPPRG
jgi:hypothetical protein